MLAVNIRIWLVCTKVPRPLWMKMFLLRNEENSDWLTVRILGYVTELESRVNAGLKKKRKVQWKCASLPTIHKKTRSTSTGCSIFRMLFSTRSKYALEMNLLTVIEGQFAYHARPTSNLCLKLALNITYQIENWQ